MIEPCLESPIRRVSLVLNGSKWLVIPLTKHSLSRVILQVLLQKGHTQKQTRFLVSQRTMK